METKSKKITEIISKSKCDIVTDRIMEFIATGEYKPEDKLPPENFFTESFNVGRGTIRESFKKLSSMGVVTVKQGQGTFVNKITPSTLMVQLYPLMMMNSSDFGQLYDARMYLESGIAQLAAKNRTQEDIDKLEVLIFLMEECVKKSLFERYSQLDIEFHTLIGNIAKNDILLAIYKMLNEVRKRSIYMSNTNNERLNHSIDSHKKLVIAIKNQEIETIRDIMIKHIEYSKAAAIRK